MHARLPDNRLTTDIVGAVRTPEGAIVGYLGVSVLVERIGRRLSSIEFAEHANCQVLDQTGMALFTNNFVPNMGTAAPQPESLIQEVRQRKTGHLERNGSLYSFTTIDSTGWMTMVEQPKSVAFKPVRDLRDKITIPAIWLIALTLLGAIFVGKSARRQAEAARRIEREVIFNEKILANMPSGIALVDPDSRHFLQANQAFSEMAKRFGSLPQEKDIHDASYDEVKIAPVEAIEKVLAFGAPFQLVEQPFTDQDGMTRFVNVNLLRLQGSEQTIQGVLYLVEDKTRDVTLRQELIGANASKDQFLALLSHELRNPLSPVIAMVGELEASCSGFTGGAPGSGGNPSQRRIGGAPDRRSSGRHAHLERQAPAQPGNGERARDFAAVLRDLPRGHQRERSQDRIPVAGRKRLRRRRPGPIAAGLLESDQEQREIHAGKRPDRDRNA